MDIIQIEEDIDLSDFECDNGSIKEKLRKAYYNQIKKISATQKIVYQGRNIGYIIWEVKGKIADPHDEWTCEENEIYGAVYLDVIVIDKRYRRKKFGRTVMLYLIESLRELSNYLGFRYLVLDALDEKIKFYEFCGMRIRGKSGVATTLMEYDFRDLKLMAEYANRGL